MLAALTISITCKIQDRGHLGRHLDHITGSQQLLNPSCAPSCREHQRLSIKGEIFSKYSNTTKTQRRSFIDTPPPPPPVPRRGYEFLSNVFELTTRFFFVKRTFRMQIVQYVSLQHSGVNVDYDARRLK